MKKARAVLLAFLLLCTFALSTSAAAVPELYPTDALLARSSMTDEQLDAAFEEARAFAANSDVDIHPQAYLEDDRTLEDLIDGYKIVKVTTDGTVETSDGQILSVTSYYLEPLADSAEESAVQRYVPCPVGPGACGTNTIVRIDYFRDPSGAIQYRVIHYGCVKCGGIDRSEVVW